MGPGQHDQHLVRNSDRMWVFALTAHIPPELSNVLPVKTSNSLVAGIVFKRKNSRKSTYVLGVWWVRKSVKILMSCLYMGL